VLKVRNVLVVEDHDDHRNWWLENLHTIFPGAIVSAAVSLAEARRVMKERVFTLAILDINLPDGSGIDLMRELTMNTPDCYGVICSIYDDDKHIFAALRAGAKGYLLKDQPRARQLQQLKEIMNGQPPLSPGVARRILNYFHTEDRVTDEKADGVRLSERENEVLRLIAKGYSRPEVAKMLDITLNTVSGYTKAIYQKLNITSRAEAVIEAVKLGLIERNIE
jgi:DNA-binding NarL/FixJ family response regulator